MTTIMLPHRLTTENFVSHRRDQSDSRFTLYDLLVDWFAERDEEAFDELYSQALAMLREQLTAMGQPLPRPGSSRDTVLHLQGKLSSQQLHSAWQRLLGLD